MLDGREWFWFVPGEFAPSGVTLPSGATVAPYSSLVSPGGVDLVACVFCVAVALWELESLAWAIAMLHDSSAIDAIAMKIFILILLGLPQWLDERFTSEGPTFLPVRRRFQMHTSTELPNECLPPACRNSLSEKRFQRPGTAARKNQEQ